MTKREVAALICKGLGLYALMNAINSLPMLFMPGLASWLNASNGQAPENTARLSWLIDALPFILNMGSSIFLWMGAETLEKRMVKADAAVEPPMVVGPEAQSVVFSALGLFALLQAIPRVGFIAVSLYTLSQQDPLIHRNLKGLSLPDMVSVFIQLMLGCWLLIGASGLANWLRSLRNVGRDQADVIHIESNL